MNRHQPDDTHLYFVALLPCDNIRNRVRMIKEDIREKYGAKHALKSPAHITLQRPFRRTRVEVQAMTGELRQFASRQKPFVVSLSGFGFFTPGVIYIRVKEPAPVISLHQELMKVLSGPLSFNKEELMVSVQPHMTVATRDISKENFSKAREYFENASFEETFEVNSIFLLRHNGRYWDILREFRFM